MLNAEIICSLVKPFSTGNGYDRQLIHAIESVIIDWSHQIRDVLKRDSSQPLLDGLNPTPRTEVDFWKGRAENLECIYDQLRNLKVCVYIYFLSFRLILSSSSVNVSLYHAAYRCVKWLSCLRRPTVPTIHHSRQSSMMWFKP